MIRIMSSTGRVGFDMTRFAGSSSYFRFFSCGLPIFIRRLRGKGKSETPKSLMKRLAPSHNSLTSNSAPRDPQ